MQAKKNGRCLALKAAVVLPNFAVCFWQDTFASDTCEQLLNPRHLPAKRGESMGKTEKEKRQQARTQYVCGLLRVVACLSGRQRLIVFFGYFPRLDPSSFQASV